MEKRHCKPNPKQHVDFSGSNVEITFSFSREEYSMLKRVADRKRRSIRSVMLRMFYDLDFKQEKRGCENV